MQKLALAVVILLLATSLPVVADTLSVGNASVTGVGDSTGSPFDQLSFTGNTNIDVSSGVFTVGQLTFTVGYNCNATPCANSPAVGDLVIPVTFGADSGTFTLPYTVYISYSDTLNLGVGTIQVGDRTWYTESISGINSGVGSVTTDVVATPEPASLALLGTGLFGVATRLRRKN